MEALSAQREQLTEERRDRGRLFMKREVQSKDGSLRKTSADSKGATFVI